MLISWQLLVAYNMEDSDDACSMFTMNNIVEDYDDPDLENSEKYILR